MSVTLTQPVAGLDAGKTYSGPMEAWLVANGYASDGAATDKVNVTGVADIKQDPQLAENREKPGEPIEINGRKARKVADAPVEDIALAERDAAPLPGHRNRVVGGKEDPEATKAAEARDGSVDPAKVKQPERPAAPEPRIVHPGQPDAPEAGDQLEKSAQGLEEPGETVPGQQHGAGQVDQ